MNAENMIALCDPEKEYVQLLMEYLKKGSNMPWSIHAYTDLAELLKVGANQYTFLLISESIYQPELFEDTSKVILLNESGLCRWQGVLYVDKYQAADLVRKEILEKYIELTDKVPQKLQKKYETKFLGLFSPLGRSLQTSFALTVGQLLAAEHSTLYLSFEPFCGKNVIFADGNAYDLADLLYFYQADREKFPLRMEVTLKHLGNLAYVPPMRFGQNLLGVTAGEWLSLLHSIAESGEFEYVILDLSECVQGLFEILSMCHKIYTMTAEDSVARSKIMQYEQLLLENEWGGVIQKTEKMNLPRFHNLPTDYEQLTRSELVKVAENLLKGI